MIFNYKRCDKMILNVKYNSNHPFAVDVLPTWNVAKLKEEISAKHNIPLHEIRIIFQGRELTDNINLQVISAILY